MPTLLAAIPHPDDESYAFAGLIAAATSAGWDAHIVAATSGEGGERHDGHPAEPATLAPAREAELARSCEALGARPPRFLRLPDGGLAGAQGALEAVLRDTVADISPDLVLALGPDGAYGHPDHIALYEVLATVCSEGNTPLLTAAFPPGLFVPQHAKCVAAGVVDPLAVPPDSLGDPEPDFRFDITAIARAKLAAIAAHATQLPGGDPHALFPSGIVAELLLEERYRVTNWGDWERVNALLSALLAPQGPLRLLGPPFGPGRAQASPPTSG